MERNTRKIGIIGGMGPETSAKFYLEILKGVQAAGGAHRPTVLMWSIPLSQEKDSKFIEDGTGSEEYYKCTSEGIQQLEKAGADFIVIPCNTVHMFIKRLKEEHKIPILSIIDETVRYFKEKKLSNAVILATKQTIRLGLYIQEFEKEGIKYLIPDPESQDKVNATINKILDGSDTRKCKKEMKDMLFRFKGKGYTEALLACTDLQHLLKEECGSLTIHDSMMILANATVREYLNSDTKISGPFGEINEVPEQLFNGVVSIPSPLEALIADAKIVPEKAGEFCKILLEVGKKIHYPPSGTGILYCARNDPLFRDQMCQMHGLYGILKCYNLPVIEPHKNDDLYQAVIDVVATPCSPRLSKFCVVMRSDFRLILSVFKRTFYQAKGAKGAEARTHEGSDKLPKLLVKIQGSLFRSYLMKMYTDLFNLSKKVSGIDMTAWHLYEAVDQLKAFKKEKYPVMKCYDSFCYMFSMIEVFKIPTLLVMPIFQKKGEVEYVDTACTFFNKENITQFKGNLLVFQGFQYRHDGTFKEDYASFANPAYELFKKLSLAVAAHQQQCQDTETRETIPKEELMHLALAKEKKLQLVWDSNGKMIEEDVPFSLRHIFAASEAEAEQFIKNNRQLEKFSMLERDYSSVLTGDLGILT